MRGATPVNLTNRCRDCFLQLRHCICARISPREIATKIVVVRHWKERWRVSNTGRIAALAIPAIQLVDYGAHNEPWTPDCLRGPNPALLFPDGDRPTLIGVPDPLIVVDATWGQARKMIRRVPGLAGLPTLALPPPARRPERLRRPPTPDGMATIESIARALDHLEGDHVGTFLDTLFEDFVHASRLARGNLPNPR